jgi:hypothetical protein
MRLKDNFEGTELYTIENDGSLNGAYTNITINGQIFKETARRTSIGDTDRIAGEYSSSWEERDGRHSGTLKITLSPSGEYDFVWRDSNEKVYRGVGYIMNDSQISVSYWDVN